MTDVKLPDLCLGIPIDHRLAPLLGTGLASVDSAVGSGGHVRAIEDYGRRLQRYRKDISENEVGFAKWLAMPEVKGGVAIVLLQPAEHQSYFPGHHQTMRDCDTLNAIDEVCRTVTGFGLENISCFDAFPFHKVPVGKSLYDYEQQIDEAYAVFLDMIKAKQPKVVFCCYRSPHPTKYKDFQCIGIGRTRDYQVNVQGQRYTCVNAFHPSYALNYLEDKSALRSLFINEMIQAFRRANGTWRESSWMTEVRENCAAIAQIEIKDKQDQPNWTKHDFQRERFLVYMDLITEMLNSLKSGAYDHLTNDELYDLILEEQFNVLFPNCLLLLIKIINFEDLGGNRLQDKGFAGLRQREERDVRDLRRQVEKRCDEFLRSLRAPGATYQVEKGAKGLFTSSGLDTSLIPLRPFTQQSGLQYNVRFSFLNLVRVLNGAYTYRGRDAYDIDKNELAQAFRIAARYFEWALAQHAATRINRGPQEDLSISSLLNSLTIKGSSQQSSYTTRPSFSPSRVVPLPSSVFAQSPPPSRQPNMTASPSTSRAPAWSSVPATPRFGGVTPMYSPQAGSSTQRRSTSTCTGCNQTGHSSSSCPKTQCYRCKGFGHMSFHCPIYPATPERRY